MNNNRRTEAWNKRQAANQMAHDRPHPKHYSNGDEQKFRHHENSEITKCHIEDHSKSSPLPVPTLEGKPSYLMSFTKGMPHNYQTGLLNDPIHFQYFIRAIDSGNPRDFRDTPIGPEVITGNVYNCKDPNSWKSKKAVDAKVGIRAWESQSAGLAYELEGPDAQAVTMPAAPRLGSEELTAEMAEVYIQALTRDVPLNALSSGVIEKQYLENFCDKIPKNGVSNKPELDKLFAKKPDVEIFLEFTEKLKSLKWFSNDVLKLNNKQSARRCGRQCPHPGIAFRGITRGDDVGPYLSQFLLIGNSGLNQKGKGAAERNPEDGYINYGSISIDQRVRTAKIDENYMTKWEEWFDVQNAANLGGFEAYEDENPRRFIHTGRDLATYVHYDALYEAYLNACLVLLGTGVKFDPGIPFQEDDNRDHQQGFAHFGGPHILSLLTEVATRALKAVRFQKYNVHRRCRPEVLAARITKYEPLNKMAPELTQMVNDLNIGDEGILDKIDQKNGQLYENTITEEKNYLLPMAFCEGSPMHPAYGAGHATVAGACITILKSFFDSNSIFKPDGSNSDLAYVSIDQGKKLELVPVFDRDGNKAHLTVEGELNKLASNISIGRNWAGVHYFTDYYESLLMGEQIAIGILEEQKLMFGENFSMTVPLFNGDSVRI